MMRRLITTSILGLLFHATAYADTRTVPDQYSTVEAAISAASAGDRIYIKKGTYTAPSGGYVISKPLEIFGDGPGGAVFAGTPGTLLRGALGSHDPVIKIDVDGNPDVTLRNIYIHDLQITQVINGGIPAPFDTLNSGVYCKITSSSKNLGYFHLARLFIYGMGGDGIHLEGLDGDHNPQVVTIEDCTADFNSNNGLYLLYSNGTAIRGGDFGGNYHKGIHASQCPYITIVEAVAESNEHTGTGVSTDNFVPSQVFLEGCPGFLMSGCDIEGFTNGGTGSLVGVAVNSLGGYIGSNAFFDNSALTGSTGIYIGYTSQGMTVGPNQFTHVDKMIEVANNTDVKSCFIYPQVVPSYSTNGNKIIIPEAADRGHVVMPSTTSGTSNLTAGIEFPRLAGATRDGMTAASSGGTRREGLVLYNDAAKKLNFWDGSQWRENVVYLPRTTGYNSPTAGIVFPSIAASTRDSIPSSVRPTGSVVYNSGVSRLNHWDGTRWIEDVGFFPKATGAPAGITLYSVTSGTGSERNALTPAAGMLIYNSSTKTLNYYDGTNWKEVTVKNGAAP